MKRWERETDQTAVVSIESISPMPNGYVSEEIYQELSARFSRIMLDNAELQVVIARLNLELAENKRDLYSRGL